jgi:hypothetical protein
MAPDINGVKGVELRVVSQFVKLRHDRIAKMMSNGGRFVENGARRLIAVRRAAIRFAPSIGCVR